MSIDEKVGKEQVEKQDDKPQYNTVTEFIMEHLGDDPEKIMNERAVPYTVYKEGPGYYKF